jgi:hypothetical protein
VIQQLLTLTLSNFAFVLLLAALAVAAIALLRKGSFHRQTVGETTFRWLALLAVGVSGVYMAMMHIVFPEKSAATIGWATSPFQYEVGMADLTVGVLGLCAFRASYGFRLATTIAVVCWFGGDAIGHIRQMIAADNFAAGNAGSWFWTDVSLPILIVAALLASCEKKAG